MSQLASPHQLCFPGGPACAFVRPHRHPASSPLSGHWRTDVIIYGLALANGLFSILCLLSTQPQPQWLCSWADPIMSLCFSSCLHVSLATGFSPLPSHHPGGDAEVLRALDEEKSLQTSDPDLGDFREHTDVSLNDILWHQKNALPFSILFQSLSECF